MTADQLNDLFRSCAPAAIKMVRLAVALKLTLLLTPHRPAAPESHIWQRSLDQGNAAYQRRNQKEARRLFSKAIDEAGTHEQAGIRLAAGLVGLANTFNGDKRYSRIEPRNPRHWPSTSRPLWAKIVRTTLSAWRVWPAGGRNQQAASLESRARTIWERLWANYT